MNNHLLIPVVPYRVIQSVNKARAIIDADISRHIPIRQLARIVCSNEYTLKHFFKLVHHTTIYQHLLGERMLRANHLLSSSDAREKDIARQCGFQQLSGFVNSYKKYYGQTPGQFRMQTVRKIA